MNDITYYGSYVTLIGSKDGIFALINFLEESGVSFKINGDRLKFGSMGKEATTVGEKKIVINSLKGSVLEGFPPSVAEKKHVLEKPATGYRIIYSYLETLGLADDPDIIELSPFHHYYYDDEDFQKVKTVVNLKQLNHIRKIEEFLHNIHQILPHKSYFVGSFIDKNNNPGLLSASDNPVGMLTDAVDPVENGIISRIPLLNMIYDFMDSRTNRYMTKKSAGILLKNAGLKIISMHDINGLTCFCSQKVSS